MDAKTLIGLVLLAALVGSSAGAAERTAKSRGRWEVVFADDFEKAAAGSALTAPWVQRHPRRQVIVTNQAAAAGKQCAMFRYAISTKGMLDKEAGAFFVDAPIPRPKQDQPATWRISAALRFHPIAWTAATLRLRGYHWRAALGLYNSMNMLILGGERNRPVWNVAEPDRWYRVRITLREHERTYDLEVGPQSDEYRNVFRNLPVPVESLPLRYVGFGYCGALVRYGQGREAYLDDLRIERLVGN